MRLATPHDAAAIAAMLALLAAEGSAEQAAMIDCLTDGPPQHSLANAMMMQLLASMLNRLPPRPSEPSEPPPEPKRRSRAPRAR